MEIAEGQLNIIKTELLECVETGDTEILETMLSTDVCPCILSEMLHKATLLGKNEVVELLLRKNANVNKIDYLFLTPLYVAAWKGHVDIVKMLLNKDANVNNFWQSKTALHASIYKSHFEISRLLIHKGANPNARTIDGDTPLHMAACGERDDIVQLLLDNGALINKKNKYGQTALYRSTMNPSKNVFKILVQNKADVNIRCKKNTVLHKAASSIFMTQILLDNGALIDELDHMNRTPLYHAVDCIYTRNIKTVKLLLDRGANPNIGDSPLRVAICRKNKDMVQVLLESGCDTSYVTTHDFSRSSDEIQQVLEDYFNERDMAFIMVSHARLGQSSRLKNFDDNILRNILTIIPKPYT